MPVGIAPACSMRGMDAIFIFLTASFMCVLGCTASGSGSLCKLREERGSVGEDNNGVFERTDIVDLPAESDLGGDFHVVPYDSDPAEWSQKLFECSQPISRDRVVLRAGEALAYVGWETIDAVSAGLLLGIPRLAQVELYRAATENTGAVQSLMSSTSLRRVTLTLPRGVRQLVEAISASTSIESVILHEAGNILLDVHVARLSRMPCIRHLSLVQCWGVDGTFLTAFPCGGLRSLQIAQLGPDTNTEEYHLAERLLVEADRVQVEDITLRDCSFRKPIHLDQLLGIKSLRKLTVERPVEPLIVDKRPQFPTGLDSLTLASCGLSSADLTKVSPLPNTLLSLDLSWNEHVDATLVDCVVTARSLNNLALRGMHVSEEQLTRLLRMKYLQSVECLFADDLTKDKLAELRILYPKVRLAESE